jgi:hypothetical protein
MAIFSPLKWKINRLLLLNEKKYGKLPSPLQLFTFRGINMLQFQQNACALHNYIIVL